MAKVSVGLLPYRVNGHLIPSGVEVVLVHPGGPFWRNKDEHAWSIVKGELEPGEDPEQAAEREFVEELGLAVPHGPRIDLGTVSQSGGKQVRAWAINAPEFVLDGTISNEFEMQWPPRSGRMQRFPEIDRAEWMGVTGARNRLVKGQIELMDRLIRELEARD